ncbi:MAG: hypothetical protein HFI86_06490 [Bacilli bacterium]|nr:hypothetical protein [Bacilli bacterium]
MKKAIFLVDTINCNFLIVKQNNLWNLPVLSKITNIEDISNKFYKKYKLHIEKISIVEETSDYILIKCVTKDEIKSQRYSQGIINDIYPIISNKKHREILFNILEKISMEIVNDSFWLGIILSVEDKIDNYYLKAILSDFLLFFSSIFCEEILTYKCGEIKDKNYVSHNQIKKIRNSYLKSCPLYNSKNIKSIISSMGINYDNFIYDIVLFLFNGDLIDINSRTWNNRDKEDFALWNGIIMSPRNWIKNTLPSSVDLFEDIRKYYVDLFIKRFNNMDVTYKSYSTYILFNKVKDFNEKTYILQRIGLLKVIMLISNTFGNSNYITLGKDANIEFSFDKFLLKVKATVIEILWNDNKNNNISFLEEILNSYPKEISENFFYINRKCRNNIHYGFYNDISNAEYSILKNMQNIYLNYVINEFDKRLNLDFNIL